MKLKIYSVGKVKQRFIIEGEKEYVKRLSKDIAVEFSSLPQVQSTSLSEAEIKRSESANLEKRLKGDEYLVVLDEKGSSLSSPAFAEFLQERMNSGTKQLAFAIGGAYGWDREITKKADFCLSLSPLTFTYQMSRLILVEQLYRGFSIVYGRPYHKV